MSELVLLVVLAVQFVSQLFLIHVEHDRVRVLMNVFQLFEIIHFVLVLMFVEIFRSNNIVN